MILQYITLARNIVKKKIKINNPQNLEENIIYYIVLGPGHDDTHIHTLTLPPAEGAYTDIYYVCELFKRSPYSSFHN